MAVFSIGPPAELELHECVRRVYEKYTDRIPRSTLLMLSPQGGERSFYVYEWFTKDSGKVFYVGKGTGSRYRHIISDMNRPRGAEYKELQDAFGIDFRFLIKGLTSFEAELYELCIILERTDSGEVLLQIANNPKHNEYFHRLETMRLACATRSFSPEIIVNDYRRRYFGVEPPDYDPFDMSRLNVTLIASLTADSPATTNEMDEIRDLIESAGGKAFSTVGKRAQTVVEFDNIEYEKYIGYKQRGLLVCHSFEVIKAFRTKL